jgi:hypothetical protein
VLEAVFILLEFSSPSRRIFIGSHTLPRLWFAVSVLHLIVIWWQPAMESMTWSVHGNPKGSLG